MTGLTRHRSWIVTGVVGLLLLAIVTPALTAWRDAAMAAQARLGVANAVALREARALKNDLREEADLRRAIGEKAYQALFTPPPRAQLVEAFRKIGYQTGLHDFTLEMSEAEKLPADGAGQQPGDELLTTRLTIKAGAVNDQSLFSFTQQALESLPGYVKLDNLTLRRRSATKVTEPPIIEAELKMRWFALQDPLQFARQQP